MKRKMLFLLMAVSMLIASTSLWAGGAKEKNAADEWPARPVSLIVPYSAGGGTDAVARVIATELQKEYGKPFNVINRDGGGGVIGHTEISTAAPDGYTIGLATFSLTTYKWFGSSQVTYQDFTPIALFNIDSTAILVKSDSKYTSLKQLIEDIRDNPGKIRMATPIGAGHHLAFANLLDKMGIDPNTVNVVPVKGGAFILQELAAGGVDVGPSTLPEAAAMIEAGKVRPLAVLSTERSDAYPDVTTVKEAVDISLIGGTWRGIVGPKGLPEGITSKLSASIERIYKDPEFQKNLKSRGFGLTYLKGNDFYAFMEEMHEANGRIMKKIGLIK